MTIVINNCGTEIDFDAAVNLMDDDIRETIHNELAPCTEQESSPHTKRPTPQSMARNGSAAKQIPWPEQ